MGFNCTEIYYSFMFSHIDLDCFFFFFLHCKQCSNVPSRNYLKKESEVAQSCRTLCDPMGTRLLCPWDFLDKSTGVGCHFLLQGIFPTQGLNPGLPHCRQMLYHLSHQGSPAIWTCTYLKVSLKHLCRCTLIKSNVLLNFNAKPHSTVVAYFSLSLFRIWRFSMLLLFANL